MSNNGFVGHPAAWFEVDEIYEFYWQNHLKNGWEMPKRWLISLSYGRQLQDHPGMYGLRLNEIGETSMAAIPAAVGDFDFRKGGGPPGDVVSLVGRGRIIAPRP